MWRRVCALATNTQNTLNSPLNEASKLSLLENPQKDTDQSAQTLTWPRNLRQPISAIGSNDE
jgi:hypothetical protein